jgi:hypothetical protein
VREEKGGVPALFCLYIKGMGDFEVFIMFVMFAIAEAEADTGAGAGKDSGIVSVSGSSSDELSSSDT